MDIVCQYKFGWTPQDRYFSRSDWGLQELSPINGKKPKVWIPKGVLIPVSKQCGQVIRLKARRHDWYQGDVSPKYVAVSGSMNGLSVIGSLKRNIMIVVESELDAYALHAAADDLVCVIAVGGNDKNPDNVTHYYAQRVPVLLICYDNDDAGKIMFEKWKNLYPHAIGYPTPFGKDVSEAIQQGLNVREWLLKIIGKSVV